MSELEGKGLLTKGNIVQFAKATNDVLPSMNAIESEKEEAVKEGIKLCKASQKGEIKEFVIEAKKRREAKQYEVQATEENKEDDKKIISLNRQNIENINENASGEGR